jgi:hypothetical protein
MYYDDPAYKLELKGVENIDGTNCYKIVVTDGDGESTAEFYNIKTNLLNRSVKNQMGQGGKEVSITTEYTDYKDVGGVLFPHKSTVSGAMPVPIQMEAVKIEVNQAIGSEIFKIE